MTSGDIAEYLRRAFSRLRTRPTDIPTDYTFKFKPEINLQSFATIAVAVNLWEQADIKKSVKLFFKNADYSKHEYHNAKVNKNWGRIVKRVSEKADLLPLPEKLRIIVGNLSEPIGDLIFHWNFFLLHQLKVPAIYLEKIFWTPYGAIDENRIFHEYWTKLDEFEDLSSHGVVFLSTVFCQERFIRKNLKSMKRFTEKYLSSVSSINNISQFKSYGIIVMHLCFYFYGEKERAVKEYKKLRKSNTIAKELFMLCIDDGLYNAATYLWSKLTEDEKRDLRQPAFKKCVKKHMNRNCYEEEKGLQIIFFMINDMPDNDRYSFMLEDDNIERIFQYAINIWPYQKMLEPMIDAYVDHVRDDQIEYFFLFCLNHITDGFLGCRFINKDVTRKILPKVYPRVPKHIKLRGAFSADELTEKLFELFDIPALSLFINDEELLDNRERFLNVGNEKFKKLIRSGNFELLNKFVNEVFDSESERKKFKVRINIAEELRAEGNVDLADKLISWIYDAEKNSKEKIMDSLKSCTFSENLKYEILNELLKIQGDFDEKMRSLKEKNEFICEKIIKIWNENDQDGEKQCFEFLKWIAGSVEGAVELKYHLNIDEKFFEKFCVNLPSLKSFKRIDDLFRFLSVTPEEILEIKKEIISNLSEWLHKCIAVKKSVKATEILIDYIFLDENEKKSVLQELFSSKKGVLLIFDVIKSCSKDYIEGLLFLLNNLVKIYGDARKLRKEVDSVEVETIHELSAFYVLSTVLDVLKKGDAVTIDDVVGNEIKIINRNEFDF